MIRLHFVLIASLLSLFCAFQKYCALKGEPSVGERESGRVISGPLSFGYGDFFMISADGKKLELEHRHESGARRWEMRPMVAKGKLNTQTLPEGKISQIVIARWSSTSLLAVIKIVANNRSTFWAMAFHKFSEKCFEETSFSPKSYLLCERTIEHDILAVSGTVNSPAYAILIGAMSAEAPSTLESGTVLFEPCGFIDGAKESSFRVEGGNDVNNDPGSR